MTIAEQRAAVVKEALSWMQPLTRFAFDQCVKGVASDCARFPSAVYEAAGVQVLAVPHLPQAFWQHSKRQAYLDQVKRMFAEYRLAKYPWQPAEKNEAPPALEKIEPEPGDFLVSRSRYIYSHGAIVTAWPKVIHCFKPCVMTSSALSNPIFRTHLRFFDPWAVHPEVRP